jgi:lysophospholipase L1-like esterase
LTGNTLRQFIWPTLSGGKVRIKLSNKKGAESLDINKVHIALAKTGADPGTSNGEVDPATDVAFTFDGMPNVTIPAGMTAWSDGIDFPLEELKLTAISIQFGQSTPTNVTNHPGSRTTSYFATGDVVATGALPGAETRDRWYFIELLDVMAPADTYAIAAFGDSITDGYGILNAFARWPDFMTVKIKGDATIADKRTVLNFGMGANTLVAEGVAEQDIGLVRFRNEVLTNDKIKWLVVMEGVNDMTAGALADDLIDAYRQIITEAHEKGILVYASPITPCADCAARGEVNTWIRTSGEFDAVIDFPTTVESTDNVWANGMGADLHPTRDGYEAMGNSVDLSLFYQTMP